MTFFEIAGLAFIVLLLLVFGAMSFFSYLARKYHQRMSQRRMRALEEESPYRRKTPPPRTNRNDFLSRDKLAEKKKQQEIESGVVLYDPERRNEIGRADDIEIVGVAEPKGFWSKFVMNQKIGYIMARANFQNKSQSGYWVNLIKAQAASQSKEQGRGR